MSENDFYAILGVPHDAPESEIKAAFHVLARQYHPDTNTGTTTLGTRFQKIVEAYTVLIDAQKRAAYDSEIGSIFVQDPPHPYWTSPRDPAPVASTGTAGRSEAHATMQQHPHLWWRWTIARVIDVCLLALVIVILALVIGIVLAISDQPWSGSRLGDVLSTIYGFITLVGIPLYFILGWLIWHRTVGNAVLARFVRHS